MELSERCGLHTRGGRCNSRKRDNRKRTLHRKCVFVQSPSTLRTVVYFFNDHMNIEFVLLWLVTLLPIIISPGPANILYAASGSSFGVKATIPFWLATNITSIFQTLAIGFGLDFLISSYPHIAHVMKYLGIIFILYLAFKFFKMSNTLKKPISPLAYNLAVLSQLPHR